MRILFIGMPDLALICFNELMRSEKNIVGVVPPHCSDPSFPAMQQALSGHNIPCLCYKKSLKEAEFLDSVKKLNPDIAIIASYNKLLPKELYSIPSMGTINCHPSILPHYRGANPYFHVINNNETETGVTFHYVDESFDTGDIIHQIKVPIFPNDTMGTLFNRLNYQSAKAYIEVINKFESKELIPRYEQDRDSSYKTAPKVHADKGETMIDWGKDSESIERFIRALNPFYGAITYFNGVMTRIWSGKFSNHINVSNIEPGTIVKSSADTVVVSTGKGVFMPEVLQFGTFFTSNVKDFISLAKPQKGDIFTSYL